MTWIQASSWLHHIYYCLWNKWRSNCIPSEFAFQTGKNCIINHFQKPGWNHQFSQFTDLNSSDERQWGHMRHGTQGSTKCWGIIHHIFSYSLPLNHEKRRKVKSNSVQQLITSAIHHYHYVLPLIVRWATQASFLRPRLGSKTDRLVENRQG